MCGVVVYTTVTTARQAMSGMDSSVVSSGMMILMLVVQTEEATSIRKTADKNVNETGRAV
jgi:hypothetical protein